MKIKSNISLVLLSIVFSLIIIEIFFSVLKSKENKKIIYSNPYNRYILYKEGETFSNQENFFKYKENKTLYTKVVYNIDDNWVEEYKYEFNSNNFGLIQNNDIYPNKDSLLFLGDSFVEGQGSKPWIDNFGGEYLNFQVINGGIMGTGPQQFEILENHISNNFDISKVLFFYIGDDYRRNPFLITENSLKCLNDYTSCTGKENFYSYPQSSKGEEKFLNFLQKKRLSYKRPSSKDKLKKYFKNLYIIKIPNNFIKQRFYNSDNEYIVKNLKSTQNLYDKYLENILFIQLKTKSEIVYGKSYEAYFAEKYIKTFTNNHYVCDFENNINYFHNFDMHPNEKGYEYLFDCVNKILKENL